MNIHALQNVCIATWAGLLNERKRTDKMLKHDDRRAFAALPDPAKTSHPIRHHGLAERAVEPTARERSALGDPDSKPA